jgi:hypothetical protein
MKNSQIRDKHPRHARPQNWFGHTSIEFKKIFAFDVQDKKIEFLRVAQF